MSPKAPANLCPNAKPWPQAGTPPPPGALCLPLRFDAVSLRVDLEQIEAGEWLPHYNQQDYGGDWRGVALRSASGQTSQLTTHGDSFANTALLDRCSYFRQVLGAFQCGLKAVRLLSLAPGSFIREHCDPALGYGHGEVRLHVPICTDDGVEFYSSGRRLRLEEGNCYYIDVSQPHRVQNRGMRDRVHLVIDAEVNEWIRELFSYGEAVNGTPSTFARFRAAVLEDRALQARLHACVDREAFLRDLLDAARDGGFDVEESDLEEISAVRSDGQPGPDWIPLVAGPRPEWVYLGSRSYLEPFFEDTVRVALRNPFAKSFRLEAPFDRCDGPAPAGLIFHMSRCGSTLAAQMLASVEGTSVISEAPAVDEAIRAQDPALLGSVVNALRRGDGPCIVKLDAWHIRSLPLIQKAFPETPWVFIYREPLEVLVSQWLCPGKLALPGAMDPSLLGLQPNDITALPREEWCARAVAGFCESALKYRDEPRRLFVNYRDLPGAVWGVAAHFSLTVSKEDSLRMRESARRNAKNLSVPFQDDSESKRRGATAALREAAAKILEPVYRQLAWVVAK